MILMQGTMLPGDSNRQRGNGTRLTTVAVGKFPMIMCESCDVRHNATG